MPIAATGGGRAVAGRGANGCSGSAARRWSERSPTSVRRRSWLRGLEKVSKRYLIQAAAHNLGIVMRKLFHLGMPRSLQGAAGQLAAARALLWACFGALRMLWGIPTIVCRAR